jgi:metal-responsive CopG/Arc/MetJ family transcriptional regulator
MSTINISLPKEQITLVDTMVSSYGFANRSEFMRAILRFMARKPEILEKSVSFPFVLPKEKSAKKIVSGFEKTKKYNKDFLKDLKEGLASSDYFDK